MSSVVNDFSAINKAMQTLGHAKPNFPGNTVSVTDMLDDLARILYTENCNRFGQSVPSPWADLDEDTKKEWHAIASDALTYLMAKGYRVKP